MQGRQSWECGTEQRPPILKLDEKHPLLFFSVFLIKTFLSRNLQPKLQKCQNGRFRASKIAKCSSLPPTMIVAKLRKLIDL